MEWHSDIVLLWGLTIDAWITIATVVTIIGVMLFTKVRTDAVMLIAIGVLFVTGVLDAKEMCAGFSAGTVVVTGVLAIVMAGLRYTGVLHWMMRHVFGMPNRYQTALFRMMVPVSMMSAFVSNTMLTVLFGNVLKRWARKLSIAPSKLYLPMVYAVQMGGVCTLIGTSTNIVVADLYESATGKTMNVFSILVPGALCLVVGVVSIIVMRRWLPDRKAPEEAFEAANDYTVELRVPSDNPNICKTLGEAGLYHVKGGNLIAIRHFDHDPAILSEDEFVMGGDRLVYTGQIDEILELKETHNLVVSDHPIRSMNEINKNYELRIAYVNFYSKLIGKTIGGSTIERDNNVILVAVARRGRRINAAPREVVLQAGDTLLFECPRKTNTYASNLSSLLQFADFQEVVKTSPNTIVSALIMTTMMILTATNMVSLLQGTVLAALAMLLFRCCTINQAMDSISWRALMSLAGAIVLGSAIAKTGIAQKIALAIISMVGTHPIWIMLGVCLAAMLITQLVENVAVTAMFFPIMYQAAMQVGYEPAPFLLALMIAANASYSTPIAAAPNMLVYGPGGYRFSDYMRIGIPLTIIVTITGVAAVILAYPLVKL
ncbi:MAG: SLC13 family permease [Prevotella sp.]|nr:SLC13 family permease [Prevotella sp.]